MSTPAPNVAPSAPRVVVERNPLDFCDVCGAEDQFGSFVVTQQNGREIALCDDCR